MKYQVVDDSYRGQDDTDLIIDLLGGKSVFGPLQFAISLRSSTGRVRAR